MLETNPPSSNVDYLVLMMLSIEHDLDQKNLFWTLIQVRSVSKQFKEIVSNVCANFSTRSAQAIIKIMKDNFAQGKILTTAIAYEIFNPKDEELTHGLLEALKKINLSIYRLKSPTKTQELKRIAERINKPRKDEDEEATTQQWLLKELKKIIDQSKTPMAIHTEPLNNTIENTVRTSKEHILGINTADDLAIVVYYFGEADLPVLMTAIEKNTKTLFDGTHGFLNMYEALIKLGELIWLDELIKLGDRLGDNLDELELIKPEYPLISTKTISSLFFSVLIPGTKHSNSYDNIITISAEISMAADFYLENGKMLAEEYYSFGTAKMTKYLNLFKSKYKPPYSPGQFQTDDECTKILESDNYPLFKLIDLRNYCVTNPESRAAKIAAEVKVATQIEEAKQVANYQPYTF